MTAAITGSAGHVGANLVRVLLASGTRVRALVHRNQRALEGLEVERSYGDLRDLDSLVSAFDGAEVVYHTAAHISLQSHDAGAMVETNVVGTRNVVEACRRSAVRRLVHFSSIEALVDSPSETPVDEERPLVSGAGYSDYAKTKAAGELVVREAMTQGLDAIVLNPTAIIGPYDHIVGLANSGLLAICQGRLWALVDGGFDFVDVRDVAQAAVRAASVAPPGSRYILGGQWVSFHELAVLGSQLRGVRVPRLVLPLWSVRPFAPLADVYCRLTRRPALFTPATLRPLGYNHHISHALASRQLGYGPRPLHTTVEETLQWFEAQ
jgi:dihydroflavonol-4-reductase